MSLIDSATTEDQRNAVWDSFLERWPAERLGELTLERYTEPGSQDTFTYWVESRTQSLGSVWGGSSFKFGVFRRKDRKQAVNGAGRTYSTDYAWYSKYGTSAPAAFDAVRELICRTAQAAQSGELKAIDAIDLGSAIKWKVAFLYQQRGAPTILPVFKESHIRAFLGKDAASGPMSELQAEVMRLRQDGKLFEFADRVWSQAEDRLNEGILTAEQAFEYLLERFELQRQPSKKMAGFVTEAGDELGLELERRPPGLYLRPGNWLRNGVRLLKEYSSEERRHSNLEQHAPKLSTGSPACHVEVRTMGALVSIAEDYDLVRSSTGDQIFQASGDVAFASGIPLNQILFGPPGTGKTFQTINEALKILDPHHLQTHATDRALLKKRFDELVKEKRVRVITFHQSFSYEDFVEGIRAVTDPENSGVITYPVEKGVFTEICEAARLQGAVSNTTVRPEAKVWKISIGRRKDVRIREECFRRGEARIGWGAVGDLSDEERSKQEIAAFNAQGENDQHSLRAFNDGVTPGDIFLCLRSRTSIEAVGVVDGDYEFDRANPELWDGFFHKRAVRWLATDLDVDIRVLNGGSALTQKTIYELGRISPADALGLAGQRQSTSNGSVPYVLIIDEINRGNVSKVFGELITLLEPSKRAGATEALEVTLPYSKRSFSVPGNVYVIGTMNTADRSLATLDIALRRRFEFIEMAPDPQKLAGIPIPGIDIAAILEVMNQRIEVLLDRDHALGHAYFIPLRTTPTLAHLAQIFRKQVLPLLQEYFFEDWERIRWVLNDHRKSNNQHQFVVRPSYQLHELIGEGTGIPTEARQWRINHQAFEHPESFRDIISAE